MWITFFGSIFLIHTRNEINAALICNITGAWGVQSGGANMINKLLLFDLLSSNSAIPSGNYWLWFRNKPL
jgi:hypothetical protein